MEGYSWKGKSGVDGKDTEFTAAHDKGAKRVLSLFYLLFFSRPQCGCFANH